MNNQDPPHDRPRPAPWHGERTDFEPAHWLRDGHAEIVKHNPQRTVYRVRLPDLVLYWKRTRMTGLRAWARQLLRGSKAKLEFDRARELLQRGIATVEPIAWAGPIWLPSESHLLTRELGDTQPLAECLPGFADYPTRRRHLAEELGRYFAHLHAVGVAHPDPHPGNILVHLDDDDLPHFHLLDLHAVRIGKPLRWREARENLILFNRWFVMRASRADRLRFWRAYQLAADPLMLPRDGDGTARELEEATAASNQRLWRSRDRRCVPIRGQNRYFRRVKSSSSVGFAVQDLPEDVLAPLLADPDSPFRDPGSTLIKDSRSSTVVEWPIPSADGPRSVIYKRYRVTSRWEGVRHLVRRPPCIQAWILGHALLQRGLPTARPLMVLLRRRHGLRWEGYLLSEKLESAIDLRQAVVSESPAAIRRMSMRLATTLRVMHDRSISHRDLKAANILLTPTGPHLIDLDGARVVSRAGFGIRIRNLARLAASFHDSRRVSRSDKLRFLLDYCNANLHGRGDWKIWWRAIEREVARKVARNRRNGRILA